VQKLSVNKIKSNLTEAEEARKVKYDRMKSTTSPKKREVGTPSNPSTKITKIKQIEVPAGGKLKDDTSKLGIVPAGVDGTTIVDKMDRGVFGSTKSDGTAPRKVAVKTGAKPNQKTNLKPVSRSTNEEHNMKMDVVPAADEATSIIDKFERGIYKNGPGETAQRATPSYEKGNATTKPKFATKTADMTRDPKKAIPNPVGPKSNFPMPSDAPKKPSWETVKGGVIVEVNGKRKTQFDIVSESVLRRMVENYQSVGYKVTLRSTNNVGWKRDAALFALINEAIDAKHNHVADYASDTRKNAFRHFYGLVESNMNGLYESRDEFLVVVREAFKSIEKSVEQKYLAGLEIFEGIIRVETREGLEDVEIMTEATDAAMAVRNVREKIAEEYGFGAQIRHIFIDGKRVDLDNISEWTPRSFIEEKKELPAFIQKKIDAKKGKKPTDKDEKKPAAKKPNAVDSKKK
jgi:hypothetical protein